jgi:hypothetical protein
MKSIRTWLFVPFVTVLALTMIVASAWARHATTRTPAQLVRPGPLDEADPESKKALIAHDIGNVRTTLANWGELGNPDGVPGYKGFEWPINSGNDFLFSGGIWVGAEVNGVHHVSTATDGDNGTNEYYPVHIGTVPITRARIDFGDWFVSSKSLTSFNNLDYAKGVKGVDDDGDWTLADDRGSLPDYPPDGKPSADYDGPNADANGDGNPLYDPEPHIDEDPPGDATHFYLDPDFHAGPYDDDGDGVADEDGLARGTQEYLSVYHDMIPPDFVGSPDPEDPHTPNTWLNVVVTQRSYAFPEAYAGDFILIDYRIRNVGQLTLKHVFVAMFADCDVGAAGEGGDPASLDDSTYYDPNNLMMITTDSNTDGDGIFPGEIGIRVVKTPVALDSLKLTYANFERVSGGDPATDADKYNLISSGQIAPASDRYGDWRMLMGFGDLAQNGFEIPPGGVLPITVAMIGGLTIDQIRTNAEWAKRIYDNDFQGPSSPDSPDFTLDIYSDMVRVRWAPNSESSVDAITLRHDFEGYIIERSSDQLTWETMAAYDVIDRVDTMHVNFDPQNPDTFYVIEDTTARQFEWQNFNLGMPADRGDTCSVDGDTLRHYCFEDRNLAPGHSYYYVVRAFDKGVAGAGILYSGRTGNVLPAIIARSPSTNAPKDLSQVYVYPNPYKGSHAGESGGQVNPSKGLIEYPRKLYFMGLPADGSCVIRIFSLAGDHLASINHSGGQYHGTEYDQWDLITKNSQEVASGIYFYTVEYTPPGGSAERFIDKFVVIK